MSDLSKRWGPLCADCEPLSVSNQYLMPEHYVSCVSCGCGGLLYGYRPEDHGSPVAFREEPPPIHTDEPHVWDLVIVDVSARNMASYKRDGLTSDSLIASIVVDMAARDAMGFERYGTHLQASNGRNPLVDAYQEALDCAVYLRQALERGYPVDELYQRALGTVVLCKAALMAMGVT